jgi:hypothetical protein
MLTHKKIIGYLGGLALVLSAASPTFAQQAGLSCAAEIAQARAQITRALSAGLPTPADPLGPNSGAGREVAQVPEPSPTIPENPASGAARRLAGGIPTPADPGGPSSGTGRALASGLPTPADPLGPGSGVGRELAMAPGVGSSQPSVRIQEAQALVRAAQSACDAGDNATGVAKARQAVHILQ